MEVKWYSLNEAYKRYHKTNNHWSHWHKIHINKENIECLCDIIDTQYVFKYLNGKLKDVLFTNENVIKELLGNKFITPIEYVLSLDEVLSKNAIFSACLSVKPNNDLAIVPKQAQLRMTDKELGEKIIAASIKPKTRPTNWVPILHITNDNPKEVEKVDSIFEVLKSVHNAFKELLEENKKLRKEIEDYQKEGKFKLLKIGEVARMLSPYKDKQFLGPTQLHQLLRNQGIFYSSKEKWNEPIEFYSKFFPVIRTFVGPDKNIPSSVTYCNELGLEFIKTFLTEKGFVLNG